MTAYSIKQINVEFAKDVDIITFETQALIERVVLLPDIERESSFFFF